MAYTKVSDLTALTTTDGAEEVLINDGGTSKKVTIANLLHDNSIDSDHYVDGSIDTAHLAADAITGAKIADDAIDSEHYVDASIDNAHLADDAVGIAELSATGTASSSTFLRGDNSWVTPTDTNTTYSAGTGITLAGTEFSASPVALTTVQTAANQSAHLALTAQEGDVVVRSDENKTYMHNGGSAGDMNDFTLMATPTDAVTSVAGNTGVVTNAHIAAAVEAASDSNTFTDADHSKLNAIEASADVTDTTNVTAAGALMDSELAGIAAVKATTGTFLSADESKLDGIAASANNYVHPNHSGEVTSTADGATVIADNIVDEANLKISNAGSNGEFLQKQSGNTGGLTWATASFTLGNDSVDSQHYAAGSIDNEHLAANSVDSDNYVDDSIDAAHLANSINTDIATGVTANTTANAALPKAGGTMTGAINFPDGSASAPSITNTGDTNTGILFPSSDNIGFSVGGVQKAFLSGSQLNVTGNGVFSGYITVGGTVDGVDIASRDGVLTSTTTTAGAALPKAGGTMTGSLKHGDNVSAYWGTGDDLQIYHDGSNSRVKDGGTGNLYISGDADVLITNSAGNETKLKATSDGAVKIYHNNVEKFETTANGVTVTGGAVGTMTTDNDGSFAMSASNNFKCTPSGNFTLTFTSIVAQSGNILLVNSGGHTVSAHANTKVDANLLATVSAAGTYLLSYFSDGTNVYMTNSAIYT